jgi:hypothetical protein
MGAKSRRVRIVFSVPLAAKTTAFPRTTEKEREKKREREREKERASTKFSCLAT